MKKKIALFCNVAADAVIAAEDVELHLRGAAPLPRRRARRQDRRAAQHLVARARADRLGARRPAAQRARRREVDDRLRRQVRRPRRVVQEPQRGAHPRRHRQRRAGSNLHYIDSEEIEKRGAAALLADVDGILVRARLRRARHRGQDRGDPLRAREARCRSSASASACRWRYRVRAQRAAASTGANSTEFDPTTAAPGHRPACPSSAASTDKGGTMRLGAYPCVLSRARARARPTARPRSASATATATRSTTTTARRSSRHGMVISGAVARRPARRDDRAAATTRTSSAASSTPSSSRGRRRRTRCSVASSRPRSSARLRRPPTRAEADAGAARARPSVVKYR